MREPPPRLPRRRTRRPAAVSAPSIDFRDYPLTADECAEIVSYIPRPPRFEWVKIAAALCATLGAGDALRVMLAQFPDEKPNETQRLIDDVSRSPKSSPATLVYLAERHGFPAREWFRERAAQILAAQREGNR